MDRISEALEQALSELPGHRELARAKVNLALHVTGRRADGYHNIETLAVFADYADVIAARPSPSGKMALKIEGAFAGALTAGAHLGENLVVRAANEIVRLSPRGAGSAGLSLTKRLPIAAGLGSGSADAAATMHLLNRMWKLGLSAETLARAGAELGADIPMCLMSRPLVAKGMGERIALVGGVPPLPVVLAFPGGGLPTVSVFAALDPDEREGLPPLPERFTSLLDFIFWLRQTRNDLARPAAAVSSLASAAAKALSRDPDSMFARMSGSGTSAFGIFVSLKAAERAAERIQAAHPDWWVAATMTGGSKNL